MRWYNWVLGVLVAWLIVKLVWYALVAWFEGMDDEDN